MLVLAQSKGGDIHTFDLVTTDRRWSLFLLPGRSVGESLGDKIRWRHVKKSRVNDHELNSKDYTIFRSSHSVIWSFYPLVISWISCLTISYLVDLVDINVSGTPAAIAKLQFPKIVLLKSCFL